MRAVTPVLELAMAQAQPSSGLAVNAPLSLKLLPGECAVIEAPTALQLVAFADLCCGMLEVRSGYVHCLGRDWADLPHEYAAALRGRIGRVFAAGGWLPFLDVESNILLPQLHHTRRSRHELRAHALVLADEFGLPGLPLDRPGHLAHGDLARAALVRAFLGEPLLVLIEDPEDSSAALMPSLLNRMAMARDRGGAVVWLTRTRQFRTDHAFPASHRLRLTDEGLTAVRPAA